MNLELLCSGVEPRFEFTVLIGSDLRVHVKLAFCTKALAAEGHIWALSEPFPIVKTPFSAVNAKNYCLGVAGLEFFRRRSEAAEPRQPHA